MAKKEIYNLEELFEAVQVNAVLEDGKTFVDCIPRISLDEIEERYTQQKDVPGFDLENFVHAHFKMPPAYAASYESNKQLPVEENIRALWDVLTREPGDEATGVHGADRAGRPRRRDGGVR